MSPKFLFPFLERKKFRTVNTRISTLENTDHSNDESDLKDSDEIYLGMITVFFFTFYSTLKKIIVPQLIYYNKAVSLVESFLTTQFIHFRTF